MDLAHASRETVQDLVVLSTKPVIDSHASPHYPSDPNSWKRLRPWDEMEWIASTGGVVCTWPIAYNVGEWCGRPSSDLSHLAEAMLRAGLGEDDIRAYFGGNLKRVLSQMIG